MNVLAIPQLDLPTLPPMRSWVERHAHAAAELITGPVEYRPERLGSHFLNTLYMAAADLLITATACSRPLMLGEMRSIARHTGLDALIVRLAGERSPLTFDIYLQQEDRWIVATQIWMADPNQQPWFVPSTTMGPAVRASACGLEAGVVPYFDAKERRDDLCSASIAFRAALTRRR